MKGVETMRRIENKDRDEENNGTFEETDERADINVDNIGIDYAESVNEEPNVIKDENYLTNTRRDRLLWVTLEDNDLDKKGLR